MTLYQYVIVAIREFVPAVSTDDISAPPTAGEHPVGFMKAALRGMAVVVPFANAAAMITGLAQGHGQQREARLNRFVEPSATVPKGVTPRKDFCAARGANRHRGVGAKINPLFRQAVQGWGGNTRVAEAMDGAGRLVVHNEE